jgi:hypothetical protein
MKPKESFVSFSLLFFTLAFSFGALAKEYDVDAIRTYLQVKCSNGVAAGYQVEDPRTPSRMNHTEIGVIFSERSIRPLIFSFKRDNVTLEINGDEELTLVKKAGIFGKDQKILLGRIIEGPDNCSRFPNENVMFGIKVGIELATHTTLKLDRVLASSCKSRSNWPDGKGRSYWRDTQDTLKINNGTKSLLLEQITNIGFDNEETCKAGKLP